MPHDIAGRSQQIVEHFDGKGQPQTRQKTEYKTAGERTVSILENFFHAAWGPVPAI